MCQPKAELIESRRQAKASGNGRPSLHPTVGEGTLAPPSEYLCLSPDITLICAVAHTLSLTFAS